MEQEDGGVKTEEKKGHKSVGNLHAYMKLPLRRERLGSVSGSLLPSSSFIKCEKKRENKTFLAKPK